ncbi:MAG: TrmH family RNA methyltransferase [Acidimicrobiales bacterium]
MLDVVAVDDPDDVRIAEYFGLRDGRTSEAVIVEGPTALDELVRSSYPIRSVLCLPKRLTRVRAALGDRAPPVFTAEEAVLRATVGFDLHRGVIASATRIPEPDIAALLRTARTILVVEGLNDHENLGALFRNARGLGADAVLLDPQTADPLYRRSVRVSMGHVLRLPFARVGPWPGALRTVVAAAGFTVVALTPSGASTLRECDAGDKLALVVGSEGNGLSDAALAAADVRVRIEMAAGVDSLNVATAAAIALYALT